MADRRRTKVVLFDFFGTLVGYEADRAKLAYPRSHALIRSWGHDYSHDEFVQAWDTASGTLEANSAGSHQEHSMLDYAQAFGVSCQRPPSAEQCATLARVFSDEWRQHVTPLPGAETLVSDLRARYRLGVVSNTSDTNMVPELVSDYYPGDPFDSIVLSIDHGYRKPHPSIYAAALEVFGCNPADAVFIGDSYEADYLGPTEAGMTAYLIDPGHRHPVLHAQRLTTIADLRAHLLS